MRIVFAFFPTVVVSSRCSVGLGLGCDNVWMRATPMLIGAAHRIESRLVTAGQGVSGQGNGK